jgi:hypothetical protein
MNARETVRDYYEALRADTPLSPYFARRPDVVKVGVFSRRVGFESVAEGFRSQRRRTTDWTVDSTALTVDERDDYARFSDLVTLAWTDTAADASYAFETRWTGVLVPDAETDRDWAFVDMHVSAPHDRAQPSDISSS